MTNQKLLRNSWRDWDGNYWENTNEADFIEFVKETYYTGLMELLTLIEDKFDYITAYIELKKTFIDNIREKLEVAKEKHVIRVMENELAELAQNIIFYCKCENDWVKRYRIVREEIKNQLDYMKKNLGIDKTELEKLLGKRIIKR